ncbi:MAG: SDR family oxidoreductase, partial [Lentisphaerae bacterium]|nr:SDR family oxidoreductase [Lentisphaerota bacterium]
MSDSIQGKIALVTGSSQGIGREIALELARQGCLVLVNGAHNLDKIRNVCEEIRADGGTAEEFLCDISNEKGLREKLLGVPPVDILVNNARLDPYQRPDGLSDGEWFEQLLHVNLTGAYLTILGVSEGMKARCWGRIVNMSSVQAHVAVPPKMIPYAVSKLGLHALTRCFALELGKYNITVNTVAPGMVVTENIHKRLTDEQIRQKLECFPLHRAASAGEVAKCVVNTLCCGAMTGETVNINSGLY